MIDRKYYEKKNFFRAKKAINRTEFFVSYKAKKPQVPISGLLQTGRLLLRGEGRPQEVWGSGAWPGEWGWPDWFFLRIEFENWLTRWVGVARLGFFLRIEFENLTRWWGVARLGFFLRIEFENLTRWGGVARLVFYSRSLNLWSLKWVNKSLPNSVVILEKT